MHIRITICFLLVILLSFPSFPQSVRESFEYSNGTVLDTLVGEAGNGWGGSWDLFDGTLSTIEVTSEELIWDFVDFDIPHTGLHVIGINSGGAWQWQRTGRYLSETWPDEAGQVYWLSFAMEMQNFGGNSWAGIGLYDSLVEGPLFGKGWGSLVYSIGSDTALYETLTEYSHDIGPVWLVAKIVMTGDTLDERLFMWVNPNPAEAEPDTATANARAFRDMNNGFNRVVYHFGGEFAAQQLTIDEIRLGTSWIDISSPFVDVEGIDNLNPVKYSLQQNYPNPFNPSTKISFSIIEAGIVNLKIYNLMGEEILTLINDYKDIGTYTINFNASGLSSGIYFYKIISGNYTEIKKMVLIK